MTDPMTPQAEWYRKGWEQGYQEGLERDETSVTPFTPALPAVLAAAQPGDVVRAGGSVWEYEGTDEWVTAGDRLDTGTLAALDPNPVRLVPLPSVEEVTWYWGNDGRTPLRDWLADRERGQ